MDANLQTQTYPQGISHDYTDAQPGFLNRIKARWQAIEFTPTLFLHLGILLLSAALGGYLIAKSGYGNTYYAAAVKSMLENWHNFFFVSYDPGGFITVDKPPLAIWLQTASAFIFGYEGWALLLPALIAQVASVELLYRMVKKVAGQWAGLIAALLLAISPISILLSATNETDPILILLMLLSGWALFKAIENNKFRYLLLSAVFVGLAFNTKMMQAYIILPAFGLTYLFASRASWTKRIGQLSVATALLLVISFAWILTVDAIPASARPYVGSTTDNSELSLAIGYNGLQRILGQTSGFMSGSGGATQAASGAQVTPNAGMGGSVDFGGQSGLFRLWGNALGGQIGWFAALAIAGLAAIWMKSKIKLSKLTSYQTAGLFWGLWFIAAGTVFSIAQFMHPYYTATLMPAIAALSGIGVVLLVQYYREGGWRKWLLPAALVAAAAGQWAILSLYPAYADLKIAVAAALGVVALALIIGAVRGAFNIQKYSYYLVGAALLAIVATPGVWNEYTLAHASTISETIPMAGPSAESGFGGQGGRGGFGGGSGGMPGNFGRFGGTSTTTQAISGGFARFGGTASSTAMHARFSQRLPRSNSTSTTTQMMSGGNGNFGGGNGGQMGGGAGGGNNSPFGSSTVDTALLNYLEENQDGYKFMVATASSHTADGLIINSGLPVMTWGGFSGTDPAITLAQFKEDVTNDVVRYVDLSGGMGGGGGFGGGMGGAGGTASSSSSTESISSWVSSSCTAVTGQTDLYDCSAAV